MTNKRGTDKHKKIILFERWNRQKKSS